MSSGAVTTTNANDLLFAPGASSNTVTQAGSGYTTRSTAFGNRTRGSRRHDDGVLRRDRHPERQRLGHATRRVPGRHGYGDSTPPSVPTGLTATAVSTTASQSELDGIDRQRRRDRLQGLPQREPGGARPHRELSRTPVSPAGRRTRTPSARSTRPGTTPRSRRRHDRDTFAAADTTPPSVSRDRACGLVDGVGFGDRVGERVGQRRCRRCAVPRSTGTTSALRTRRRRTRSRGTRRPPRTGPTR